MAQTWYVIRGGVTTQISGGNLSYRVSANNIGTPPKRNLSTRGPFQHGETFYGFRYDKRVMSLVFYAESTSLALADAKRDAIYNLWKGIEGETVTIKVVRDDGASRLIDGEIVNIIDFPDSINDRFGTAQSFAVQLECHNPFWRKEAATVAVLTINGTTTIPYAGQFPAEPIINIVGPITNPVVTQLYTGKKLDFTGTTISPGNNYQIDTRYGYKTVLDGSAVNRIANLTNDSDLADFNVNDFPDTSAILWETGSAAEQNSWQSVAYGNSVWVAVSIDGTNRVMRSTNNGVTWSAVAASSASNWKSIAYGNGVWIAIDGQGSSTGVMRSVDDGVTWANITTPLNIFSIYATVAYGGGVWIAMSGPYTIRSTDDGLTWNNFSVPTLRSWTSVVYGNGVWVAVSTGGTNQAIRSTDGGLTWSEIMPAEQNFWESVAYGDGVWIAVASTGTNRVMRSTNNGVTWSAVAAVEQNSWQSVAYGDDVWIAVASGGTNRVMHSTNNGVTWNAVAAAEQNSWQSVAYGDGVWIAVSADGTNRVMRNTEYSQVYTVTGTSTTSATSVTMTYNELYLGI